ncbi:hypothetical protein MFLAVUS_009290 [Mucor flavus]|uniref:Uncharacterized protein n=1 Tax=Mucor flavus TaxID=439312 RepID=A0ABP9Z9I2_9FUNG
MHYQYQSPLREGERSSSRSNSTATVGEGPNSSSNATTRADEGSSSSTDTTAIPSEESCSSPVLPVLPIYKLRNNVDVIEPLTRYVKWCEDKSKKSGFFLRNEPQEILASKGIILLKQHEIDPKLIEIMGEDNIKLLKETVIEKYIDEDVKVGDNSYTKLTKLLRVDQISEMELTTNYIDSILSPLFHIPEINKHLLCNEKRLNRKEENTDSSRPDGVMKYYNQKSNGVTFGYCEVKPTDSLNSIDLLCQDLVRLALFSRNVMLRKTNHISCCLQIVGMHFSFYVLNAISRDISIMNEFLDFDIPSHINELGNLNNIIDKLKKISVVYDNYCLKSYVSNQQEETTANIDNILKPQKRKRSTDIYPVTFI